MELLLVKATLELASGKQIHGQAMEELLGKLRHSALRAEDLLDELDYFRIHDEIHGTYDAADHHVKRGIHNLTLNLRHATKSLIGFSTSSSAANPMGNLGEVGDAQQQVSSCPWPRARQRSTPNIIQADNINGCMSKLGKLFPCSSSPHVHARNSGQSSMCGVSQRETPMPEFNRVHISEKMKHIVEQLQPVRIEVAKILQSCDRIIVQDIAQSRPITTGHSIEPKLYGRDHIMDTIIHDMTKGKYHNNDLTVLPIVGPGGIGKTTLIQHIHRDQQVQEHFQVIIWVCVSFSFNLNKLLEEIKTYIPRVEGEKDGRVEESIEQRLRSKRFLLVLDDIWKFSDGDDWKRLLLPLRTSQEKGSMILVTTRFPAIAKMVQTTNCIELEGLEHEEFRKLFLAFVFGDEPIRSDHKFLLEIGDKIIEKLRGSPLAAKTVGTLLSKDLNLCRWIRILESKEWEMQTRANDIMPALKLSYDYLPYHQQQCFFYSALFPEDYKYSATELINLWVGLDILQPIGQNQTPEEICLSNLNDLVTHGFFREEEIDGDVCYVMHDLLHDLALKVASHECLVVHHSNVSAVEIHPSILHLSIIIDDDDTVSHENFKSQIGKLKTRLKVKQLRTVMLFGDMDKSLAIILGDFLREANALRCLRLVSMSTSVESMLPNFSALVHLRYLCLGTKNGSEMHLPLTVSRFYHLNILDLGSWYRCGHLPRDLSNLVKLRHFYTRSDNSHSRIYNVGKLRLLQELKAFIVNRRREGFEPMQLEHLTELRELGIVNLENIHTIEEASQAKLKEKKCLERLTLVWDSKRSNGNPYVEALILESLQPHRYLQKLCIGGQRGPSCPSWLGDKFAVEALRSFHLVGVSWQCLPSLGKMLCLGKVTLKHIDTMKEFVIEDNFCRLIRLVLVGLASFDKWATSHDAHHMFPLLQVLIIRDCPKHLELPFTNHIKPDEDWNINWFPKLQELEIHNCPEFLLVARIPWTETLRSVSMSGIKLLELFVYNSNSFLMITGKDQMHSLDQVLAFNELTGLKGLTLINCPTLEMKHLLMLSSLKMLLAQSSHGLDGLLGGEGDVEWQHPLESLVTKDSRDVSAKDVIKLLTHLPRLSKLDIGCRSRARLAVGVDVQSSHGLVGQLGGEGDVEWEHPLECLGINDSRGASAKDLTELLTHLPRLSRLDITGCKNITQLAVGLSVQQTWSIPSEVEQEKVEDGLLLFPAHLSDSLQHLSIGYCPELVLVDSPSISIPARSLRSLKSMHISRCPKILPTGSFSCWHFLSSLQILCLSKVEGMETLEPLSNLTSLTRLELMNCGEDLRCQGLESLTSSGGQLRELLADGSPTFFSGWDPNSMSVQPSSSKLEWLCTEDAMGLLVVPICSFLSSSLTELRLWGDIKMEHFTKEQEDALRQLASLQQLEFWHLKKLQSLPTVLHNLRSLRKLRVHRCPAVRSLPKDGLPKSLLELIVSDCGNMELKQQCRGLVGTIPQIGLGG